MSRRVLAGILLSLSTVCLSQELPSLEYPETTLLAEFGEQPSLDRSRDWLAGKIENISDSLDNFFIERFFSDSILDDNIKGSRALISLNTRRVMGHDVEYFLNTQLRIVLPHTNERLKLLISSDDDSDYSVERDPLRNIEKATYSTALRFILVEKSRWSSDFDMGLRWHEPLDPYARIRFRRHLPMGLWSTQITQSFYHFLFDGFGEKTDIFSDYNLTTDKLLRVNSSAEYKEKNQYFDVKYGLSLYHKLRKKTVLAYLVGAEGDTSEKMVFKNYHVGIRYRKLIYKDWIFAEVSPRQEWNADNGFRRENVLMFKIEALIE